MCCLLTPNLTKTSTMCQTADRQHTTERDGRIRERERERQGAAASRKILLRKKLSFSKALKSGSESSSGQEDTPRTQMPEADSHSILEYSILHSTLSNECLPSVVSTPSPSMVAVGLVRQSDLPLSWLDPTSVFSCNGLYVPRETRNTLSHSCSKESESCGSRVDPSTKTPELLGETSTSEQSPPCVLTSAPFTPRTPTYLGVNISPVVRLDRCLLSIPGSSHGNQSTSTNRRRRTASVPKDILCSLSKDSMAGEENKENQMTTDTEKLTKLKSSRSLPASPVVLCTKLPLLRRQDNSKPPLSLAVSPKLLQQKIREAQESATSTTGSETQKCKDVIVSWSTVFCRALFLLIFVRILTLHFRFALFPFQCIHPEESLHKSGRYCSRQYQNLCLWLAKNGLLLVNNH